MLWIVGLVSFFIGVIAGILIISILNISSTQDYIEERINDYINNHHKEN